MSDVLHMKLVFAHLLSDVSHMIVQSVTDASLIKCAKQVS